MEQYLNVMLAILVTTLAIALIGILVVGGYLIYKVIKEEF